MKTYTVQIQSIEHYSIEVEAEDKDEAEERAWGLFPHASPCYGENNVTEVTCATDTKEKA